MKNILIVSKESPPMIGGAGIVAWQNASAFTDSGSSVTLLTVKNGKTKDFSSEVGFNVVYVQGLHKLWVLSMAWKLSQLKPDTYDVIIFNDVGAAMIAALFFRKSAFISKSYFYLHGGEYKKIFERRNIFFNAVGFPSKYKEILTRAKGIIAVSKYLKNYFSRKLSETVRPDAIFVVYAGVDDRVFNRKPLDIRSRLNIKPESTILLSVSRITLAKGYPVMLERYENILKQDTNFHWIIVGSGSYLQQMKRTVSERRLEKYVTILGAVERNQLSGLYSAADLFWLLTGMEAFGLVYIEAQLCGLPALGYNRHGVTEAIHHGRTGYLIGSSKEAEGIILGREYLTMDSKEIVNFAKNFSLQKQAAALGNIFKCR